MAKPKQWLNPESVCLMGWGSGLISGLLNIIEMQNPHMHVECDYSHAIFFYFYCKAVLLVVFLLLPCLCVFGKQNMALGMKLLCQPCCAGIDCCPLRRLDVGLLHLLQRILGFECQKEIREAGTFCLISEVLGGCFRGWCCGKTSYFELCSFFCLFLLTYFKERFIYSF